MYIDNFRKIRKYRNKIRIVLLYNSRERNGIFITNICMPNKAENMWQIHTKYMILLNVFINSCTCVLTILYFIAAWLSDKALSNGKHNKILKQQRPPKVKQSIRHRHCNSYLSAIGHILVKSEMQHNKRKQLRRDIVLETLRYPLGYRSWIYTSWPRIVTRLSIPLRPAAHLMYASQTKLSCLIAQFVILLCNEMQSALLYLQDASSVTLK